MKKGVFTIMHYLMPLDGVLSLHSSANEGIKDKDVSLFFGLSGTGKTTLSADPNRKLIGDDEHCWSDTGIFNIEGGCYAKAIDLSPEKEPEIYNAIRFGSILENVSLDSETSLVDFSSSEITENSRVCYPIDFIPNAKIPGIGGHPKNIIFLTCDAYGVLPPVSLLSVDQAMYYFISGYTSKVAGTEEGVLEPSATFSACFGAPFLVHPPALYAKMLAEKLEKHGNVKVWLLNTGWIGGAPGVIDGGERIPLKHSRAIVDAIHSGELLESIKAKSDIFPLFNLQIPALDVAGIPASSFNSLNSWKQRGRGDKAFMSALGELKRKFDKVMQETL
ncbi:UNVERIFIED_CONTAM: Protein kinase C-like 1 [Siphonaria sp. JEL0065]|nr:Protein kinase C-like 1 [Siphonaria sp. JEL0065]